MLPIVTIGLTDVSRPLADHLAADNPILHFDTAEKAHHALGDALAANPGLLEGEGLPVRWDDTVLDGDAGGAWICHVIYGEFAFGPAVTGQGGRLAHTGYTLVFTDGMGQEPSTPRRIVDGEAQELVDRRMVPQAATVLRANAVFAHDEATDPQATMDVLRQHLAEYEGREGQFAPKVSDNA